MARPGRFIACEREFWVLVAAGVSVVDAAKQVGVSRASGQRWFRDRGGVNPHSARREQDRPPGYRRISHGERHQIHALRSAGFGPASIAGVLGRSVSSISRELARHTTSGGYVADAAQHRAEVTARAKGVASQPTKLTTRLRLRAEVENRLIAKNSPQQIANRLRVDFPDEPEMWVSHETIYKSLYVQSRGELRRELTACLRTGRTLRRPRERTRSGQRKERFAGMVSISERPAEVADRAVPGHWEGDLILGSQASRSAVGTLVERTTRFVMLLHLPGGHTADIVQEAMVAKILTLPEQLRRSLTWDQGSEMANHVQIAAATGMDIYFCDPHSPWQRGSNENTNGLLRQYLPKGADLSFYGPGLLDQIAQELNDRPRQTLGWRTPAEALTALLSGPTDPTVALTP